MTGFRNTEVFISPPKSMDTGCSGCCCLFPKRRKRDKKPSPHVEKHYNSKEHLLGFTVEEVEKATHTATKRGVKSTNLYTPPYGNSRIMGSAGCKSGPSYLGPSYIGAQYKVSNASQPGQRLVKDTHRVVRSEVVDSIQKCASFLKPLDIEIG